MKAKMQKAILDHSMINDGDSIVVALSGGADSVALLHALNSAKEKYNIKLYACHLNHMIRGEEADSDELFAKNLCDSLSVQLFVKHVDVPKLAQEQKISLELCGRNVRYEFFSQLSDKLGAKVATAHTASDNTETVLYNISRGTSLNGLCGIKPVRDYIIRPLIYSSREEIESYCSENALCFVTDSTNLTDDYTRNNIRHNCVPVLKQVNQDLFSTVSRMCSNLRDVKEFLDKISEKELKNCKTENGYSCEKLLSLESAVLSNALFMILKDSGVDATYRHIDMIVDELSLGGCVDLPSNKRAVCKQGVLRIIDVDDTVEPFEMKFKDFKFVEQISYKEIKNINKNLLNDCISCDIITDETVVRNRREGDTFSLCGRNVTKSLKKLLNELKVPSEKRSTLLLVANGSTVLWLEGVGVSKDGIKNGYTNGAYRILGVKND